MAVERIDEISEPPIVGRAYLVPTVRYPMHGLIWHWPVMGPRHTDVEHLNFPSKHYHFDHRFFSNYTFDYLFQSSFLPASVSVHARVLAEYTRNFVPGYETLPEQPIWKKKVCLRPSIGYPHDHVLHAPKRSGFMSLWAAYAGKQARRSASGSWLCPHRQYPLGAAANDDGILTCPLHGLRICARSGVVVETVAPSSIETPAEE